jgi:hypothetical protein
MNKRSLLVYIPLGVLVALNPICIISYILNEQKIQLSLNLKLIYELSAFGIITIILSFVIFFLYTISHPKFEAKINTWLERGESN